MEYINVRKRNSAKSYRETQPANMDTLVCLDTWRPFRLYVWTAVLAASYLGLPCRPRTYLSEDVNRLLKA